MPTLLCHGKVCQSALPPDYRGDFGRDPLRVKCDLTLTSRWRRPGAARMWCIYVAWMKVFHFPKVVQDKWMENVRKWFKCVIFESGQTYHLIIFDLLFNKNRQITIGIHRSVATSRSHVPCLRPWLLQGCDTFLAKVMPRIPGWLLAS